MNRKFLLLITTVSLLAACSLPSQPLTTPTADAVATQVSQLLTTMPTATIPSPISTATPQLDPTDTVEVPTPTQEPTQAEPTSTIAPVDLSGKPDWRDTLDDGTTFYQFENANSRVTHQDGRLILSGLTPNGWHGWSLTFSQQPRNFNLEAIMTPQTCSGSDLYGLVFRAPNANSGYFFGVTCDGRYNLHRRNFEDGTNVILVEMTSSSSIQTGPNATNRLGIKAENERIGLYANDALLQEAKDSTYLEGYFGAFVAASETAGFTAWLDEIALWKLP